MSEQLRIHQAVRIRAGKYGGCVGTVEKVGMSRVLVRIGGVIGGQPLQVERWLLKTGVEVVSNG